MEKELKIILLWAGIIIGLANQKCCFDGVSAKEKINFLRKKIGEKNFQNLNFLIEEEKILSAAEIQYKIKLNPEITQLLQGGNSERKKSFSRRYDDQ